MQTTPYLYFKGSCEAALGFYEACGLGKLRELRRYAGTPLAERDGSAWSEKVLHSVFEGPGLRLCASDGPDSEPMKGCALFLEFDDLRQAEQLFARLSAGGRVSVPFKLQFWGDHYGNFTDQFGVQWAMNVRGRPGGIIRHRRPSRQRAPCRWGTQRVLSDPRSAHRTACRALVT